MLKKKEKAADRAIFTIVTKSYLAFARVLAKELHVRHPELPFYVFLADRPDGCFQPEHEPFTAIPLENFFPSELMPTMPGYYTAFEFCNALKPFAHLHLANKIQAERWFYLDSDIFVCGDFDPLFDELDHCSILLTGHILKPVALAVSEQLELSFLTAGIYNGGFVGLKNTTAALDFLRWWKERLIWHCLNEVRGLEADQLWLNFVPQLFPECKVIRNPEVNVAYWNFHERELELDANGDVRVAGKKIPFLHFSGWNWRDPEKISKFASPNLGNSAPAWNHLRGVYLQCLLEESVQATSVWPYSFGKTTDGRDISLAMRRGFLSYCRKQMGKPLDVDFFLNPELFVEPPKFISLMVVTRNWGGALLRALGLRRVKGVRHSKLSRG